MKTGRASKREPDHSVIVNIHCEGIRAEAFVSFPKERVQQSLKR